jgi:hypothetical protein
MSQREWSPREAVRHGREARRVFSRKQNIISYGRVARETRCGLLDMGPVGFIDWLGIWCDCLVARSLGRVMVSNQPPAPLLLYPYPGKASVTRNSFTFVLPIHC